MVRQRTLTPPSGVRIPHPQPILKYSVFEPLTSFGLTRKPEHWFPPPHPQPIKIRTRVRITRNDLGHSSHPQPKKSIPSFLEGFIFLIWMMGENRGRALLEDMPTGISVPSRLRQRVRHERTSERKESLIILVFELLVLPFKAKLPSPTITYTIVTL